MADVVGSFLSTLVDRTGQSQEAFAQKQAEQQKLERDLFKDLLDSPDERIRSLAATGWLQSANPKSNKGLRAWMGEVQSSPVLGEIQKLMGTRSPKQFDVQTGTTLPRRQYTPGAGGPPAALPTASPVEPGSQPMPRPQAASMSPAGGAAVAAPPPAPMPTPSYSVPPQLDPSFDENNFQTWYQNKVSQRGFPPDPDSPANYDYRAAYRDNAMPYADETYKPSEYELRGAPAPQQQGAPAVGAPPPAPPPAPTSPAGDVRVQQGPLEQGQPIMGKETRMVGPQLFWNPGEKERLLAQAKLGGEFDAFNAFAPTLSDDDRRRMAMGRAGAPPSRAVASRPGTLDMGGGNFIAGSYDPETDQYLDGKGDAVSGVRRFIPSGNINIGQTGMNPWRSNRNGRVYLHTPQPDGTVHTLDVGEYANEPSVPQGYVYPDESGQLNRVAPGAGVATPIQGAPREATGTVPNERVVRARELVKRIDAEAWASIKKIYRDMLPDSPKVQGPLAAKKEELTKLYAGGDPATFLELVREAALPTTQPATRSAAPATAPTTPGTAGGGMDPDAIRQELNRIQQQP